MQERDRGPHGHLAITYPTQRCLEEAHTGMRNKQCQFELADCTRFSQWVQLLESSSEYVTKLYRLGANSNQGFAGAGSESDSAPPGRLQKRNVKDYICEHYRH